MDASSHCCGCVRVDVASRLTLVPPFGVLASRWAACPPFTMMLPVTAPGTAQPRSTRMSNSARYGNIFRRLFRHKPAAAAALVACATCVCTVTTLVALGGVGAVLSPWRSSSSYQLPEGVGAATMLAPVDGAPCRLVMSREGLRLPEDLRLSGDAQEVEDLVGEEGTGDTLGAVARAKHLASKLRNAVMGSDNDPKMPDATPDDIEKARSAVPTDGAAEEAFEGILDANDALGEVLGDTDADAAASGDLADAVEQALADHKKREGGAPADEPAASGRRLLAIDTDATRPIVLQPRTDKLESRVPPPPQRFAHRINKLCDETDWDAKHASNSGDKDYDLFMKGFDDLGTSFAKNEIHRHQWEPVQAVYALKKLGLLHDKATALGVGTGTEAMSFYLATQVGHVTATDSFDGEYWLMHGRESTGMLTKPEKFAPFDYPKDRLRVLDMSGTDLTFEDQSFDIVWAFSAIETFGGHLRAAAAVSEMARVVKPGGALILTTQLVVNGVAHYATADKLFRRDYFLPDELEEHVIQAALSEGLELVEEVDLNLSDTSLDNVLNLDSYRDCVNHKPHVLLHQKGSVWTSVVLAFRRPKSDTIATE